MKRRWNSDDLAFQEVPTTPSLIGSRGGTDVCCVPNTSSPDSSRGSYRPINGTSPVTPASTNEGVVPRVTPASSTLSYSVESGVASPYNNTESDVSVVSVTPSSIAEQRVPRNYVHQSELWFDLIDESSRPYHQIEQHTTECRGGGDADNIGLLNSNFKRKADNAFILYFEDDDADIFDKG